LVCFLIFCLNESKLSSLNQSMSSSPGYRFGTFFLIIPLSPVGFHFSLGAHSSSLRSREIMIKNMIDLSGVPLKPT
ncbi:hypothetical protein QBC45DRAFT_306984, partial [Copromyces sp. CBS 386.78]